MGNGIILLIIVTGFKNSKTMNILFLLITSLFLQSSDGFCCDKTNSLKITNKELEKVILETFDAKRENEIVLIRVIKHNDKEYGLKIMKTDTLLLGALLKNEYGYSDLVGFFQYKNATGIVYGENQSIFFKKLGEINIPDYYLHTIERIKKSSNLVDSIDSDIPPIRYDGSVFYYKYENGEITFERSKWANIWGEIYKQYE